MYFINLIWILVNYVSVSPNLQTSAIQQYIYYSFSVGVDPNSAYFQALAPPTTPQQSHSNCPPFSLVAPLTIASFYPPPLPSCPTPESLLKRHSISLQPTLIPQYPNSLRCSTLNAVLTFPIFTILQTPSPPSSNTCIIPTTDLATGVQDLGPNYRPVPREVIRRGLPSPG